MALKFTASTVDSDSAPAGVVGGAAAVPAGTAAALAVLVALVALAALERPGVRPGRWWRPVPERPALAKG